MKASDGSCRVVQLLGHAVFRFLTVIFGLWCLFLSYDKTPLDEFEIVGNACAWSCFATAASLLLMTPFYYLDKRFQTRGAPDSPHGWASVGARIVSRCTLVFAIFSLLSLIVFMIALPAFLLAKSYVIFRPFL